MAKQKLEKKRIVSKSTQGKEKLKMYTKLVKIIGLKIKQRNQLISN